MRKSSFDSPNVIPIDEIKTVEAKKDFIGSSLHVNGEESDFFSSGGTKLKGMECIAKMITELCRYVYEEKRKKDEAAAKLVLGGLATFLVLGLLSGNGK